MTIVSVKVTKPKRQRRPALDSLIREAEKAGKSVSSITTPDGTTVRFGEPGAPPRKPSTDDDVETWINRHAN